MKRLTVIPVVALCGVLAATGSNVAIARAQEGSGAERVLTETRYDVSEGALLFPCSENGEPLPEGEGEPIAIQGYIAERFMAVDNPSGGVHYAVKTRPEDVYAFGETSGEEFRIRDTVQFVGNERLDGWTLSYRQAFKMVGTETHRTFWVVAQGHYLILHDGTIMLHRDILRSECGRTCGQLRWIAAWEGGGARSPLTPVRPTAASKSARANLSAMRTSVAVGYRW